MLHHEQIHSDLEPIVFVLKTTHTANDWEYCELRNQCKMIAFSGLQNSPCLKIYSPVCASKVCFDVVYNLVFSQYIKLAMLAFLYCFNFDNLIDIVISYLNCNSKCHDKCTQIEAKLISFTSTSNLFSLEVIQKCQHFRFCVVRENSNFRNPCEVSVQINFACYESC